MNPANKVYCLNFKDHVVVVGNMNRYNIKKKASLDKILQ